MKKILNYTEFYIAIILIAFCLIVQGRSGQFFTGNNIVDLIRSFTIPVMFAIGEMMVIISGGTDVSFPAIASLSLFISSYAFGKIIANPIVLFLIAMLIGLVVGAVNGFIIAKFKFPTLIVTLATSSICFGIMQGVFKSREYPLPESLLSIGKAKLFSVTNQQSGLTSDVPVIIIFMILLLILGWFILNKTILGRGIYAIGGDEIAAERAGFNVFGIKMFIYCFSGAAAGMIGMFRTCMLQQIQPNNLAGLEMTVIAACVLGGVKITGGKGTVLGAILGMALLTTISNSLILLGIGTEWQNVFTGLIIIIGTAVSAIQTKRNERKLAVKMSGKQETVQ